VTTNADSISPTMEAVRLHAPGGLGDLVVERIETPHPHDGEALVRVHAAAITKGELEWPEDRLPAIPSYELSGTVVAVASGIDSVAIGDDVYALTAFDRDGVAAEYAVVPAEILAPKPRSLDHVGSAAVPLAALSARQGLFDHGRLEAGQRTLITGAAGGVGHFATQLAHGRGAHVIGITSPGAGERARTLGADDVSEDGRFPDGLEPVDLVFDTVGGELLQRSLEVIRPGGKLVTVAEDPPDTPAGATTTAAYFLVEPDRQQLIELAQAIDDGDLRPSIDSVFPLADARGAFERSLTSGKSGKVVIRIIDDVDA
jgi:NADPH:quinone reductase-like Zn-dependent oxidoreductase